VVALFVSGKQFVGSFVGQSPQDPRTVFPLLSTWVEHHGVRYPPAYVHSLYSTPLALKGNTQADPDFAPDTVVHVPAAPSYRGRLATTIRRAREGMVDVLATPDFLAK